ncbi:MAG: hypothetical protein PHW18_01980 [Sulfuricurvum sp.]|uniref:hypothetical protein n=1 Tax=Sulfuricurvum sp. TaxID=2025608 RepID=UPI00261DDAE4|nr:hypothetical protein [Sulfuricurvum sp.]MDD2828324.1 hypothetical protein [Sulfuricurvum sp.]MDD4949721.1 hypothetical protein [Sulfuricurvum sp.]
MKRLLYPLYIFLILVVMIPKERLYFEFESLLSQHHLFINNETFSNRLLTLEIENGELLLDNGVLGTLEHIHFTPWIVFNQLSFENLSFSPLYRTFFPGNIDSIRMTYSLIHPLLVTIEGEGDFGHCSGAYDLMDEKIRIVFDPTPQLRRYPLLVGRLHQEKEGLVYESSF